MRKESDSNNSVPQNKLGITNSEVLAAAEDQAFEAALEHLIPMYHGGYCFTAADIRTMHKAWLGELYEDAGEYRTVNASEEEVHYAPARQIPKLMKAFEKTVLCKHTPCSALAASRIVQALAHVHVEVMLIHPFLTGNSGVARMLSTIMALQAGLPLLKFQDITGAKQSKYRDALSSGLNEDYVPMVRLFEQIIATSIKTRGIAPQRK